MGGAVCIGSCAGRFYLLDRGSGASIGDYDVQADGVHRQFHGDPAVAGDLVLVPTDSAPTDSAWILALDARTARLRWRLRLGHGSTSDIALTADRAYAVTLQDEVVCFDPASGAMRWSFPAHTTSDSWRTGAPLPADGRIVFGDRDGTVHALDAIGGRELWRRPLQEVRTWIAATRHGLHVVRGEGTVVTLDPTTGVERNRTPIDGGPYVGPIAAVGDSLLLLLGEHSIACFDVAAGKLRWKRSEIRNWSSSRPYLWHGCVLAGTENGSLFAFDLATGETRWIQSVPGMIRGIGWSGDTLYVGTFRGRVTALVWQNGGTTSP